VSNLHPASAPVRAVVARLGRHSVLRGRSIVQYKAFQAELTVIGARQGLPEIGSIESGLIPVLGRKSKGQLL
jgi:hypothetical protein